MDEAKSEKQHNTISKHKKITCYSTYVLFSHDFYAITCQTWDGEVVECIQQNQQNVTRNS